MSIIVHENLEPGVIDTAMIVNAVLEQSPKGEKGRLIAEEGVILEEVESLRLEFFNILKIDHLWMMESLVKLQIGNNIIEKMENLEKLVNLRELDLSFNNIEEIENIEELVKLEVLTLFENKISELKNMETLVNLTIFSIGNNLLTVWDNVLYLRQFQNLRSLNMAGNPCAKKEHFKEYIYAFLPQLVYNEYRMIFPLEREEAYACFKSERKKIMDSEAKDKEVRSAESHDLGLNQLYADAFVENLQNDHLFKSMFVNDVEGLAFLKMNEETEEAFCEYKEKFLAVVKELFDFGLAQHKLRQDEISQYNACITKAKSKSIIKSRDIMGDFIEKKAEIFFEMRKILSELDEKAGEEEEEDEVNDVQPYYEKLHLYTDEFQDISQKVWQNLMKLEMTLFEQIEDTTGNFEVSLNEMKTQFLEETQGFFLQFRELENNYFEQVSDLATRFLNNCNIRMGEPGFTIDKALKLIMTDKENLAGCVSGSHDLHLQVIDAREDVLNTRVDKWVEDYITKLRKDEVKRNREKIVETSHFMDLQQEEFEELQMATEMGESAITKQEEIYQGQDVKETEKVTEDEVTEEIVEELVSDVFAEPV